MKHKKIGILTFLFFILLLVIFYAEKSASDETPASINVSVLAGAESDDLIVYNETLVKINEETFSVLIANTPKKRARGLSGRGELATGHGMLFVFDQQGDYPFWMKDMNFAIDILWINEDNEIIHILEDIKPETYPTAFTSPKEALYVLELPKGIVAEAGIKLGDKIVYQ